MLGSGEAFCVLVLWGFFGWEGCGVLRGGVLEWGGWLWREGGDGCRVGVVGGGVGVGGECWWGRLG